MKPDTTMAMRQLIAQIRSSIPFDTPESTLCSDHCRICSKKLLEFLASELEGWEYMLRQGQVPNFGDLSRLERVGRKVYSALKKMGFVKTS